MAARLLGIATRTIYRHLEKQDDQAPDVDSDDGVRATIEGETFKIQ